MAGPAAQARPHRPLLPTIGLGAGLHQSGFGDRVARQVDQERVVVLRRAIWATLIGTAILAVPAAAEAPKYGGTLTYMIPADAPPSFDGHRESTYATVHSVAPFYSVLIRVNPENPSDTTQFICDLCTEIYIFPYTTLFRSSTRTRAGMKRMFSVPARSNSSTTRSASRSQARRMPIITTGACPISMALPASMPISRRCGSRQSAATGPPSNFAACPPLRATNSSRR